MALGISFGESLCFPGHHELSACLMCLVVEFLPNGHGQEGGMIEIVKERQEERSCRHHVGSWSNISGSYSKVHNDGPVQLSVVYTIVLTSVTQAGLLRSHRLSHVTQNVS